MYGADRNIRILIVEDDEEDFFVTADIIKKIPGADKWRIDWCYQYQLALDHICEKKYDLYFIDYYLGNKTGLDLLKESVTQNCMEPIIMLTGKGNLSIDQESMTNGATDYLVKSELNAEKLERSIRYALEKARHLRELRTNEQKYRSIFEHSIDAIFLMDDTLRLLTINKATSRLLGYTETELGQMRITDLIADPRQAELVALEFAQNRIVKDMELEFRCSNGDLKICQCSLVVSSENAENEQIQGILHDISELRQAELAISQIEKASLISRLVQTLAHEIRNPLNNVSLASQQLRKEPHHEDQVPYLDMIIRNNNRINIILKQLMFSSGEQITRPELTTVQDVINDAIEGAKDRIILKDIDLEVEYPDFGIPIVADKGQLSIAILNIITNAIEAMENVKGALVIKTRVGESRCEIEISDNGSGITEENQKKIFDPYFTTKRTGLGFGLAGTLNILQVHKAAISVVSTPGKGSRFTISVPMANP